MADNSKALRCSFCGKPESQVHRMIQGPGVRICDECVHLCLSLLDDGYNTEPEMVDSLDQLPTPQEIKAVLDQYVVGQEAAKIALSVSVYNHYKRIFFGGGEDVELQKSNILMIGPTGSGKTLFAQTLARVLKVPFAIADATTLTEAGYVGDDVENILLRLLQAADFDVELAERGIIYVDEIDKIARKSENTSITRDVSGEGVQQALLKMIESGTVSFTPDSGRNQPPSTTIQVDTTNILFILSGAFNNIGSIVQNRIGTSSLGFHNEGARKDSNDGALRRLVETEDVVKFGLIPEFMGRIPVIVTLDELDEDALLKILWQPKNSILRQYERLFELSNVTLTVTEDARRAIVREAIRRKSGARGLRSIFEEVMLNIMYEVPSMEGVVGVTIDEGVVLREHEPEVTYYKQNAS